MSEVTKYLGFNDDDPSAPEAFLYDLDRGAEFESALFNSIEEFKQLSYFVPGVTRFISITVKDVTND
jgi:hypothetical protein